MKRIVRLATRKATRWQWQFRQRFAPLQCVHTMAKAVASREPELRLVAALCRNDRASADVGVLWGEYALEMSRHSKRCYAFEPNPEQVRFLERAFRGRAIRVMPTALSNRPGRVTLRVPTSIRGHGTIEPRNVLGARATEWSVEASRLDDHLLEPLGLVKIDVEGHELAVLEGMAGVLDRDRPRLIVEIEDRFNRGNGGSILSLLRAHGYRPNVWDGSSLRVIQSYDDAAVLRMFAGPPKRANNYIFVHESDLGSLQDIL